MSKNQKTQKAPQVSQFPTCINKKQARLVCLNPDCQQHAFFCTACDNDECEVIHHHGKKLQSVSFKEYLKKVLKDKYFDDQLQKALNRYQQCLDKLKKDVQEFVEKEKKEIEQIKKKANEIGEQEEKIVQRLRKKEYQGLKGSELDKLWQKMSEIQNNDKNQETIQFLSIKQEEIKQISDNFEKVNKMEMDDLGDGQEDEKKTEKGKTEAKSATNAKQTKDVSKAKKEETTTNTKAAQNKNVKKK